MKKEPIIPVERIEQSIYIVIKRLLIINSFKRI